MLDDVEREIVRARKAPDRENEQQRGAPVKVFGENSSGGKSARDNEQAAFEPQQPRALNVTTEFHASTVDLRVTFLIALVQSRQLSLFR